MSVISDVQNLYGTLHTTWSKVRVHVISHVVFFVVVFWMGGVTITNFSLPHVGAKDIADNDWFKLAKETGLIYVVLVLPVIVASVYLTIFDLLGRFISLAFSVLFLAPLRLWYTSISASELLPIAKSLPNDKFDLGDILTQSRTTMFKLQEQIPNEWGTYQKELSRISGNSVQYLGGFCTLLLFWIILFVMQPSNSWIEIKFWPTCLILLVLVWFASMRTSRALAALPILQVKFVSAMMQMHPSFITEITDDEREKRFLRVEYLLRDEKNTDDRNKLEQPSFRRVLGLTKKPARSVVFDDRNKLSFYERGKRLNDHGSPSDLSVADVVAYKFFIAFKRLTRGYGALCMLIRYAITGIPM